MTNTFTNNQALAFATIAAGTVFTTAVYFVGLDLGVHEPWYIWIGIPIAWALTFAYYLARAKSELS